MCSGRTMRIWSIVLRISAILSSRWTVICDKWEYFFCKVEIKRVPQKQAAFGVRRYAKNRRGKTSSWRVPQFDHCQARQLILPQEVQENQSEGWGIKNMWRGHDPRRARHVLYRKLNGPRSILKRKTRPTSLIFETIRIKRWSYVQQVKPRFNQP